MASPNFNERIACGRDSDDTSKIENPNLSLDVTPVSSSEYLVPVRRPKRICTLTCNICNRDLDSKETSTSHIVANHMDQTFFDCTVCPFRSRGGFQGIYGHTKRVHKDVDPNVVCDRVAYMAEVSRWTSTCFDKLARNFHARLKRARLEEMHKQSAMAMDMEEEPMFADLDKVKKEEPMDGYDADKVKKEEPEDDYVY